MTTRDRSPDTLRKRFFQKIEPITETGCWIWTGAARGRTNVKDDCRGVVWVHRGKLVTAHRHAYELFVGPIPDGKLICHRCGVSMCVNPSHLYAGTALENARDRTLHGRTGPKFKGGAHHAAKYSDELVLQFAGMVLAGSSQYQAARELGIHVYYAHKLFHTRGRGGQPSGCAPIVGRGGK